MRLFHAKVNYKAASGVVKDDVNSSFSCIATVDGATNVEVANVIADTFANDFLNHVQASTKAVASLLGPSLSRAANDVTIDVYGPLTGAQLNGAIKGQPETYMGSPLYTELYTIGAPADSRELPRQACIDLVLRASGWEVAPVEAPDGADLEVKVDRPRQRLTGRIKVGPFNDGANAIGTAGESRPAPLFITTLQQAADRLRDQLWANPSAIQLAVWSRKNLSMVPVTDVQVPNAFCTVQRRKPAVTARNLLAID